MGISALRIENKADYVTDVPGLLTWICAMAVEGGSWLFGKAAGIDATSFWPRVGRALCQGWCWIWNCFQRKRPSESEPEGVTEGWSWMTPSVWHVWGYFHVGQALKLDYDWVKVPPKGWPAQAMTAAAAAAAAAAEPRASENFLAVGSFPNTHNLELYLYLVSLLTQHGPPSGPQAGESAARNPLLLNKSADILADTRFPADWWAQDNKRGCTQTTEGHWVFGSQTSQQRYTPTSSNSSSSQGYSDVEQKPDQLVTPGAAAADKAVKVTVNITA